MATEGKDLEMTGSEAGSESNSLNKDGAASKASQRPPMTKDGKYDVILVPSRQLEFTPSCFKDHICFNPVVSLFGVVVLWGLAIWCMVDPEGSLELLLDIRRSIGENFSWFVIVTKPIFFFFLLFIAYKFGHVKMGGKDEPPEFDGLEFFTMLFAAGIAVGLFYYAVAEPLWHQNGNAFAERGYRSQDEIDQAAMNLTLYHYGTGAWCVYLMVAVTTGLAAYRFKLPLTFRTCFYPIIGEYTWGWLGDLIDGVSIVVTVAGVCTSLGIGAMQLTAGFQRLGWLKDELSEDEATSIQSIIIWVITAIATASVISGLGVGVKYLSMFAFGLGMFLTFIVLILEDTPFMLNLQVQTIGYYLQNNIFQLHFHTDAFAQLKEGEGRNIDGNAAGELWMEGWTIFYWNWWVSWACFVGLFVARISRGRTVGEVIGYSLVGPIGYCIFWFCIWGGSGLRQSRQAMELQELGTEHFNNSEYFQNSGNPVCYDVPQEDLVLNGTTIFTNYLIGVTPVCNYESFDMSSFNVLYSFSYPEYFDSGFGPTLTVLYLVAVAVYFCTSSDSGSLVVDFLASNGRHEHHWLQRLFWAFTEGAVATALLNAGGSQGLSALQAASIIAGLPYTVLLMFLMHTMYDFCRQAENEDQEFYNLYDRKHMKVPIYGGIFNIFEYITSMGDVHPVRVELGMDKPKMVHVTEFFKGMFVPYISYYQVVSAFYNKPNQRITNILSTGLYAIMYYAWIALFIAVSEYPALRAWGWCAYFINGVMLTSVKIDFRTKRDLHGTAVGDFFASLFLFPQVFAQLVIEVNEGDVPSITPSAEEVEGLKASNPESDHGEEVES